jgi:hypothetical protein
MLYQHYLQSLPSKMLRHCDTVFSLLFCPQKQKLMSPWKGRGRHDVKTDWCPCELNKKLFEIFLWKLVHTNLNPLNSLKYFEWILYVDKTTRTRPLLHLNIHPQLPNGERTKALPDKNDKADKNPPVKMTRRTKEHENIFDVNFISI